MKLLFVQGGSRWKFDNCGNVYTDANFNEHIWDRYRSYCEELTVMLKSEEMIYDHEVAKSKFNFFDSSKSRYVSLPDIYKPVTRFLNIKDRRIIQSTIEREVLRADAIIIRSIGTYYTNTTLKIAQKHNKPYSVEETGFSFEALWYHSLFGKMAAIPNEISTKRLMKKVPSAIYVTNKALQKRYPCKGKSIGCSDVEISINDVNLEKKLNKQEHPKVVFGTAAFLDVGWKGQKYVIRAIGELKKAGINNIEYQLIGSGTGDSLKNEIAKYDVSDEVRIIGALPHNEVFAWLDNLDVYIQTSFMEGLCRSIIEAMSRACPVLCTDVGGNNELVDKECLIKKGNVNDIKKHLVMMLDKKNRIKHCVQNFEKAKEYEKTVLDAKRDSFYHDFFSTVK